MLKNYEEIMIMYNITINALRKYIKENNKRPSEKIWNKYAVDNNYLSSEAIGYISKIGFNKLCRNLIKSKNNKKK